MTDQFKPEEELPKISSLETQMDALRNQKTFLPPEEVWERVRRIEDNLESALQEIRHLRAVIALHDD